MSFFVIVILIFSLMYGYIGWRLIIPAALGIFWNSIFWGLFAVFVVIPFVPIIFRLKGIENTAVDLAAWIGYFSLGFFSIVFAFLVVRDLIWILGLAGQKTLQLFSKYFGAGSDSSSIVDSGRRGFILNSLNLGILGVSGAMTGYGLFQATKVPAVKEVEIPFDNLPPALNGLRIVQITDIHASSTIKRPFVQAIVDTVNGLDPDIVALTGDLVDGSVPRLRDDVAPLAGLKARHGSFFVTGNHEYYSGVKSWIEEVERLGLTVLMNEHLVLEHDSGRILLAGVTDYTGGQFHQDHNSDPHKAISGAPLADIKILLAHQPKSIFAASEAGYDLQISGHTHGGQYFPYHFLAALAQPYIAGLHKHGNTRIYVSRGTGYWGPQIRIGAPSEITVLKLVKS